MKRARQSTGPVSYCEECFNWIEKYVSNKNVLLKLEIYDKVKTPINESQLLRQRKKNRSKTGYRKIFELYRVQR